MRTSLSITLTMRLRMVGARQRNQHGRLRARSASWLNQPSRLRARSVGALKEVPRQRNRPKVAHQKVVKIKIRPNLEKTELANRKNAPLGGLPGKASLRNISLPPKTEIPDFCPPRRKCDFRAPGGTKIPQICSPAGNPPRGAAPPTRPKSVFSRLGRIFIFTAFWQ